jgi:DNA-binding FadR family transcriptional regulator
MEATTLVCDRILDQIRRSGRNPGERILTERAFQDTLGISRSRVRDALAALEAQGVIARRIGSGTYLARKIDTRDTELRILPISTEHLSPASLIEARMVLEVSMLPLIIAQATNSDLKALKSTLDCADTAKSARDFEKYDTEFHYRLGVSAHNDLLSNFAEIIVQARKGTEWGQAKERSSTPRLRRAYQSDHRKILQAIRNRDLQQATTVMRAHLTFIREHLVAPC